MNREYLFLYNMYKDKVIAKDTYTEMKKKLDEQ